MPVENFSLNPEFLNIQYLPIEKKMERNQDLYGIDQTVPSPLRLPSKSPIYGPGLIVENGQTRQISREQSIEQLSEGSRDIIAKKAQDEEKKAKKANYIL
jgi:hypothetical protein